VWNQKLQFSAAKEKIGKKKKNGPSKEEWDQKLQISA